MKMEQFEKDKQAMKRLIREVAERAIHKHAAFLDPELRTKIAKSIATSMVDRRRGGGPTRL